jgi:hypothetical protein
MANSTSTFIISSSYLHMFTKLAPLILVSTMTSLNLNISVVLETRKLKSKQNFHCLMISDASPDMPQFLVKGLWKHFNSHLRCLMLTVSEISIGFVSQSSTCLFPLSMTTLHFLPYSTWLQSS